MQDIVNELGRRLEYKAENGRYQGVRNSIGFDGLWEDFLIQSTNSFLVLGCADLMFAFLIPHKVIKNNLENFNKTIKKDSDSFYWHLRITQYEDKFFLHQTKIDSIPINDYMFGIK